MKRNFRFFGTALTIFLLVGLVNVSASEVTVGNESDLVTCLNTEGNVCKLNDNIVLTSTIVIKANTTLDLNDHSITPSADLSASTGLLIVVSGYELTINDSGTNGKITTDTNTKVYAGVQLTLKGDHDDSKIASLIVNGGTIEGYYYGIVGNGTRHNTNIVINGGTIKGLNPAGNLGIYHPQDGTLVVNGGTITGGTGIELRSGNLEVNGGTITGTAAPTTVNPNGNGSTIDGAGIAVAQHTTKLAINVVVNDGTIKGYTAFYESNPQNNEASAIAKIKLAIKGGAFTAINGGTNAIYSEDFELENIMSLSNNEEYYEVTNANGEKECIIVSDDDISQKVDISSLSEENITSDVALVKEALNSNSKVAGYFDINLFDVYGDYKIAQVAESNGLMTITLDILTGLESISEGYTRNYYIIRVHNGKAEKLEAVDNGNGTVSFQTDKFSTYALVYEDIKNVKTSDINLICMISVITVAAIGLVIACKKLATR